MSNRKSTNDAPSANSPPIRNSTSSTHVDEPGRLERGAQAGRVGDGEQAGRARLGRRDLDVAPDQYDQHESRLTRLASDEEGRVERDAWPEAGDNAAQWSGAPVLDLVPEPPRFLGEPIEGNWRERVRASRRGNGRDHVLGVHLKPRTEVRHLLAVLEAAGAAGYRTVALQARGRQYPYPMREYRLAIRGGRTVSVRDVDTIQYLVRTLDNAAGRGARPLRLSAR